METQRFKRSPAIRCWIKNILDGKRVTNENAIFTIFGKIRRVRIVATIINKREFLRNDKNDFEEEKSSRIDFYLDDGTGLIRAVLWDLVLIEYDEFVKGDIVDIIGLVRSSGDYISINLEIMKKVNEPNFILLRNAEIIKEIKFGDTYEIPEEDTVSEESEIDINDLFKEEDPIQIDTRKEEIFMVIKKVSSSGTGIRFTKLKEIIQISEAELRSYIKDLMEESKIYESETEVYQTF